MRTRSRVATLLLAWLIVIPVVVLVPQNADAAVAEDPFSFFTPADEAEPTEPVFGERLSSSRSSSASMLSSSRYTERRLPTPEWRIWPGRDQNQIVNLESFLLVTDGFRPASWRRWCFPFIGCLYYNSTPLYSQFTFTETDTGQITRERCWFIPGTPYIPTVTNPLCGKKWYHSSAVTGQVKIEVIVHHFIVVTGWANFVYWADSPKGDVEYLDVGEVLDVGQTMAIPAVYVPVSPGGGSSDSCSSWGIRILCWVADRVLDAFPFLQTVVDFLEGCGDAVVDAAGGLVDILNELKGLVTNPSEFINGKLQEMKELFAAVQEDPGAFIEAIVEDLAQVERLKANGAADWAGFQVCRIAIEYFTGKAAATMLVKVRKFMNDRNDGPDAPGPRPCRNSSFPGDTLVRMADGSQERIDSIEPGDWVISHNLDTSVWEPQLVVDQWSHLDRGPPATLILPDNGTVTATADHLFWVVNTGQWTELQDVTANDIVLTPTGEAPVKAVTIGSAHDWTVWEITVVENHNFLVEAGTTDVLVHNGTRHCSNTNPDGSVVHTNTDGTYDYVSPDGVEYKGVKLDENGAIDLDANGNPRPASPDADTLEALLDDHAYQKHVVDRNEFPDVQQPPDVTLAESKAQFQNKVQDAINNADHSGYDSSGTRWFYDKDTNTVIYDGSTSPTPHAGTAFRPNVPNYELPDGTIVTDAAGNPLP